MAEELQYASSDGGLNKRKYEERQTSPPPPVARRTTGFSSAPDPSGPPPPAYSSVPPPMSEIELAKQKAQEIAARLLNSADPTKRARFETGAGGGGGGFDSSDTGVYQKPMSLGLSGPTQGASYGYPGPSKKIEIPSGRVGVIIGKGGETIKYLQLQSGAKIQVTRDTDADPYSSTRGVELSGTPDQMAKAEQLINDVLAEAETGGSGGASRRMTGQPGAEQFVMSVPNNKVGLVIGKGGETIKSMQATTGARIQVIPLHLPPGDMSKERTVQIDGTAEQIEAAKQLVNEVTSENRPRNLSMTGGYPPQVGYQARPPTSWTPPTPPMQQPGYGYVQPGSYPGPSPQYMNQPPYSGYPPQPNAGAYASGWDQTTAPPQQPPQAGGGYDYYNQQQQQPPSSGAPTDGSGYNYSQPPPYNQGQGYENSYGGGYGQTQQGYNSSYGNVTNPTPDSSSYGTQADAPPPAPEPAPGQSYNAGGSQPSPNPNYPSQASSAQSGYGTYGTNPQGNYKPPSSQLAYAQPQQGTNGQGGGYAQQGYPGYGAPPAAQPGYGQQPPPYNSSYGGGGYAQHQAYSSDVAAPQSSQTGGAAKTSPPSG